MNLVAKYRRLALQPSIDSYKRFYSPMCDSSDIVQKQLQDLNLSWKVSLKYSSLAREIARVENLPNHFQSWAHFDQCTPVMNKESLRRVFAECEIEAGSVLWRSTGGSTGEPFKFPVWPSEAKASGLDIWLGRSRYGIRPDDSVFLFWGHAHLFGSGLRGIFNRYKRCFYDRMLGYTRFSAYNLTSDDLSNACNKLLACKPSYVIGYSSALDRFVRQNSHRASDLAQLKLKAVIATAEGLPFTDSSQLIRQVFGTQLVMEYGAVETGPLAYQDKDGSFPVFHAHHRLSLRGGDGPFSNEILVTSLYPRALPLMRYALGDLVDPSGLDIFSGSLLRLRSVVGRCNESVELPNSIIVHSEAFSHCLRDIPEIQTFQIVIKLGCWPKLHYVASHDLSQSVLVEIRRRLSLIDKGMQDTPIERVDYLPTSVAGKYQMVRKS